MSLSYGIKKHFQYCISSGRNALKITLKWASLAAAASRGSRKWLCITGGYCCQGEKTSFLATQQSENIVWFHQNVQVHLISVPHTFKHFENTTKVKKKEIKPRWILSHFNWCLVGDSVFANTSVDVSQTQQGGSTMSGWRVLGLRWNRFW